MFEFESFTDAAKMVMGAAVIYAKRFNHEYVGTEHILLALVGKVGNEGAETRAVLGFIRRMDLCTAERIQLEVGKLVKPGPDMATLDKLPLTPRAKKVVEYSIEEARNLESKFVGTPHLFLGCLREHDGVAAQVLMTLNFKLEEVRQNVLDCFPKMEDAENEMSGEAPEAEVASKTSAQSTSPPFSQSGWHQREVREKLAMLLNKKGTVLSLQEELQIVQIHATLALSLGLSDLSDVLKRVINELSKD